MDALLYTGSMNDHAFLPRSSRLTPHRVAVLQAVAAQPAHLSAAQVYDAVRRAEPRIAFATVYNALHYLVHAGLIAEVRQPDGVTVYDRNTVPHDHIACRRCGRLDDVPREPEDASGAQSYGVVAGRTGYTVDAHRVEYVGLCPACRGLDR